MKNGLMSNRFADLHCHPHMRSFNWLHKGGKPVKYSKYHAWWIIFPKKRAQERGNRASAYSQCDLAKLINGRLKLAFVSLYPMEKGWVSGRDKLIKGRVVDLKKVLGDNGFNNAVSGGLDVIVKPLLFLLGHDKGGNPAIRDFVQSIYMKLPFRRINFFQSKRYDYFDELLEERNYLLKRNNQQTRTEIYIPFLKRMFRFKRRVRRKFPNDLDAEGTYILATSGNHVKQIVGKDKLAFVLTIEGANVFNSHESYEKIEEKILHVKSFNERIFFITFCHHFYNYLAGHAHSIPDIGQLLLDQSEGLSSGFTDKGKKVLHLLLSIDENYNLDIGEFGRRILIDVKHMNAIARREFYDVVSHCHDNGDRIPIVASHVAYSGRKSLKELIRYMPDEKDGYTCKRNGHGFNAWNINLCDEDVLTIFRSGGLIGVNLDQRVLGVTKHDIKKEETHVNYIWQNMKAMLDVILNSTIPGLPPKEDCTKLLCLGTDFDGYIDPVNKYPTVLDFDLLRTDLINVVSENQNAKYLFGLSPTAFVDRICFDNAHDFVVNNL